MKKLTVGEELIIEVDLNEIPNSKREEDVNQEDAVEVPEDQLSDEEIYGATGRVKKIPDETLNEPNTESMRNARNMNTHLDEDALSDISEVSKDCPQTIKTVKSMNSKKNILENFKANHLK